MQYRRLGGTDLDVSTICFGPMRSARKEPGEDPKSRAGADALRAAIDAGVNFLHSSYEYGTRWMMGEVLRDHPKRTDLHHVIKLPVPDFQDSDRFDPDKFRMRVEEALTDLHAERIAVLQYMWRSDPNVDDRRLPLLAKIVDDVRAAFEKLRDEGKVGYLFTFPYTVQCGRAAIETGRFSGLIAYFNAIETEMVGLFEELKKRDMGFLCIRPLYQGILTDERADRDALPRDDRFRDVKFDEDFRRRARLAKEFADEIGESMTGFALRFALADPVVASLIVGLNTAAQVESTVRAVERPIPDPTIVRRVRQFWAEEKV